MGLLCIQAAMLVNLLWYKPLVPCWVVFSVLGIRVSVSAKPVLCVLLSLEHFQFLLPACFLYCPRGHLYAGSKSELSHGTQTDLRLYAT